MCVGANVCPKCPAAEKWNREEGERRGWLMGYFRHRDQSKSVTAENLLDKTEARNRNISKEQAIREKHTYKVDRTCAKS